jgi:hypothetical protein
MGHPTVETPTKFCEWCNAPFNRKRVGKNNQLECVANFLRRKFCSLSCSVSSQHARPAATVAASRKRAAKLTGERCEACGFSDMLLTHHVNGNPMDNSESNRQTLCSHCHSFWHAMLVRTGKPPTQRMPPLLV